MTVGCADLKTAPFKIECFPCTIVHLSLHAVTELTFWKCIAEWGHFMEVYRYKTGHSWVKRAVYSEHNLMQRMNALWRYSQKKPTLGELGRSILHCWTAST